MGLEVNVLKDKLLKIMKDNREKHVKEYEQAMIDYKDQCVKALEDRLEIIKKEGKILKEKTDYLRFKFTYPTCYKESYDEVIGMLELSTDDKLSLSDSQYRNWVMDKWSWKRDFNESISMYRRT